MKRILSFMFVTLFCVSISAQVNSNFKLTSEGTFVENNEKDFIVVQFEGKSASDLFSQVKKNVMLSYKSPKDVISEDFGKSIIINGYTKDFTYVKSGGMKVYFSCNYVLQFQFKDGRMRISAPIITRYIGPISELNFESWLKNLSIFKNGQPNPKKQVTIDLIEGYFNNLINNLTNANQNKTEEDW